VTPATPIEKRPVYGPNGTQNLSANRAAKPARADHVIRAPQFANGNRRKSTNEASDSAIRKIWMIVELFRHKRLSFEMYHREHERDKRSFQRDLQQLRAIGDQSGFTISPIKNGSYVEMRSGDVRIRALHGEATQTEKLIGDVARAMGQPIATAIGQLATEPEPNDERFFHIAVPTMSEGDESRISLITTALKSAWTNRALVKFRYVDREDASGYRERTVEPHRVLYRSGVYYLIAYDRGRKAWRTFALDRFLSSPEPAGTNNVTRQIPAEYASEDVIGFMKSDQSSMEVTVELSRIVAAAATSRRWQTAQRVDILEGGRARIAFTVSDPSEVARWAFGFGKDARVVAPPEAVRIAGEMARAIAAQYEADAARRPQAGASRTRPRIDLQDGGGAFQETPQLVRLSPRKNAISGPAATRFQPRNKAI
jgi:predicted DNA-binding transcriptional regulator YafY